MLHLKKTGVLKLFTEREAERVNDVSGYGNA
jgi:hypothetical protein